MARSVRLSSVDLSAIAAFTAAALSAVNVLISYRLTSRGHREQWRREQERPIVARILTVSTEITGTCLDLRNIELEWARPNEEVPSSGTQPTLERYAVAVEQCKALRYEVSQLDLLASSEVHETAKALVTTLSLFVSRLDPSAPQADPPSGQDEDNVFRTLDDLAYAIARMHERLREQAREDLGL